ncbi:TlpA family protein disulfide reductase [Kaistella palustris]|uniref:TlpA family protein disulfide reductase n=1 Tax=Kaistella palustris TaxID=493376 RepID=UPI0003FFA295|nr:TlpA disulfide reductase family protein [Kaistella palustris]
MKKIFGIACLSLINTISAQFKVFVEAPAAFTPNEVYLYSLNGSKDILNTKEIRKGNTWQLNVAKPYTGMMKLYFPEQNVSINFISENKDVKLKFQVDQGKIKDVEYLDESNSVMNNIQDIQQKKEFILPALVQMKSYYKDSSDFGKAVNAEIARLNSKPADIAKHPFISFYNTNYSRFLEKGATQKVLTHEEIIDFLTKSNDMLESSSLLRPVLVAYLNVGPNTNITSDIDALLKAVNVETPRGQTILSELIEIFDAYDMKDLKEKYLTEATNLKCTINDRLSATIATNKNTEMGAVFPNYVFKQPSNTSAKSIADVKAAKKVIIFWASTCSHCEKELPTIIEKYAAMKVQNIQVIALSLDSEKAAYDNKVKDLPWINDSELKGWNSSYVDQYNVHATPTYFILDSADKIIAKPDHAADVIKFLKLN